MFWRLGHVAMPNFAAKRERCLLLLVLLFLALSHVTGLQTRLQRRRDRLRVLDRQLGPRRWTLGEGELAARISGIRPAAQIFR